MEIVNESAKLVAKALENLRFHQENCIVEASLIPSTIDLLEEALIKLTNSI